MIYLTLEINDMPDVESAQPAIERIVRAAESAGAVQGHVVELITVKDGGGCDVYFHEIHEWDWSTDPSCVVQYTGED